MIKNIIFDYGEVIVNVDTRKTISELKKLTHHPELLQLENGFQNAFFNDFERGHITPEVFRNEVRSLINSDVPDEAINFAWNAMLEDLPVYRLKALAHLKTKYRTFLLSNTNVLHLEALAVYLNETYGFRNLADYFEKEYYSNEIGMRKPDREIFEFVLETHGLKAEETVFLDDNQQNIATAAEMTIQAHRVTPQKGFVDILKVLNLY